MKINKQIVLYTKTPPPAILYIYNCDTCKHFLPPNDCESVCRRGLPDLNEINPKSWCILWLNKPDVNPLNWIIHNSKI